jgi:hypothetical protein
MENEEGTEGYAGDDEHLYAGMGLDELQTAHVMLGTKSYLLVT